jgi:ankyrin repeat protein
MQAGPHNAPQVAESATEHLIAAEIERMEKYPSLIEERKDVWIKGKYADTTPLLIWSIRSYIEKDTDWAVVKCLLRLGANVGACDSHGRTALMWAAAAGNTDVIDLIVSRGGDVNEVDDVRSNFSVAW